MSRGRLVFCVLLPFAAGYFLSYAFRTINALIAGDLVSEFALSAADLGLLTSVYFLVFAAVQLPLGALLDRYGPATIQSALLLLASAGALVFATAETLAALLIGRALLALGVAVALMAGLKAIVLWFPPQRVAFANGWLVMLGALGAVTATAPAEIAAQSIGWRSLFALLAGLSALAALFVLFVVPDQTFRPSTERTSPVKGVSAIYRDRHFWRVAPLSAAGIATSWSLQGLWAAPWLRDVDGLDRSHVVQHLFVMAAAVCASALLLGTAADRLRKTGRRTESLLAYMLTASMLAQAALLLRWPLPSLLLWSIIAAAGGATVLSFAILAEHFSKEIAGRGNAALNLLHVGGAFVSQSLTGFVVALWPQSEGGYPAEAHQAAMSASLGLQLAALAWFALSQRFAAARAARTVREELGALRQGPPRTASYPMAAFSRMHHAQFLREQAASWRLAAAASTGCVSLMLALAAVTGQQSVVLRVLEDAHFFVASTIAHIEDDHGVRAPPPKVASIMRAALARLDAMSVPSGPTPMEERP